MSVMGGLFGVFLVCLYLGIIIFLITLLWRTTRALESTSRHLLEMARDLKKLSQHFNKEDEE